MMILALLLGCGDEPKDADEQTPDSDAPGDSNEHDSTTSGDSDATTGVDADGDGHASLASGGDDCDDGDVRAYPGASDTCEDGVDQDCSGADEACETTQDSGDTPCEAPCGEVESAATALIYADAELSQVWSEQVADVDGDGDAEIVAGASTESSGDNGQGAVFIVDGPFSGTMSFQDATAKLVVGGQSTYLGQNVSVGDLDGDGNADVAASAQDIDADGRLGGALVFFGPFSGEIVTADATVVSATYADYPFPCIEDLDGDGADDLALGAADDDTTGEEAGAVWFHAGPIAGTRDSGNATAVLLGEAAGDAAGRTVSTPGDVDGDGIADLLVGAPERAAAGAALSSAYLVRGPISGTLSLGDADTRLSRTEPTGYVGATAASEVGDLDGDGLPDLAVIDLGYSGTVGYQGGAFLFSGLTTGDVELEDAPGQLLGAREYEQLSRAAGAGDVDGDGTGDLAIGVPGYLVGYEAPGAVYLAYGPFVGARLAEDGAEMWYGGNSSEQAGTDVDVGDLDGDGTLELVIAAPGNVNDRDPGMVAVLPLP